MLTTYLLVALGSAIGGGARYWVNGAVANRTGETYPWGTFVVNITGALLIGLASAILALIDSPGSRAQALFIIGLCGSYTTVSSFSLQTLALARDGEFGKAAGNILLSLAGCTVAVWFGLQAGFLLSGTSA